MIRRHNSTLAIEVLRIHFVSLGESQCGSGLHPPMHREIDSRASCRIVILPERDQLRPIRLRPISTLANLEAPTLKKCPQGGAPKGGAQKGGPRRWGTPKISRFCFPLPPIFILHSFSWKSFRGIFVEFQLEPHENLEHTRTTHHGPENKT